MKDLFKQQRELCFKAWAHGKSNKFPAHLYNHFYDTIMGAEEPEYSEPSGVLGIALGAISGALVTALAFWMFVI